MSTPADAPKSATTITVGCKIPNGLLLELGKRGEPGYQFVMLNGANTLRMQDVAGGFGLTEVDAGFYGQWVKRHGWMTAIRNGQVFNVADRASAQVEALSRSGIITGMEPLSPADVPKEIEVDESHLKAARQAVPPSLRGI